MDQIPALDNTLGAAFIGVILASVLYGVSCFQVFYYFNNYSKQDGYAIKALVIATWMSDTVHQALICHTIYSYLVKGFFNPQQLNELVWSLLVEVIFNGITALLVQSFYAVRLWKLSDSNLPVTATLVIFILAEFASVIAFVAKSLPMKTFAELATLKSLSMVVNVLGVACDVLITVVYCILLYRARARSISSSAYTKISLLIAFSVQTGMVTSISAIASLISISVSPHTLIYVGFYFTLGRLYCNSLLATLNVRKALRSIGNSDVVIGLHRTSNQNSSNMDNRTAFRRVGSRPIPQGPMSRAPGEKGPLSPTSPIHIDVRQPVSQNPSSSPESSDLSLTFNLEEIIKGPPSLD